MHCCTCAVISGLSAVCMSPVKGRYLYFSLDVVPCRYQLIQRLLGVLHAAAVLAVDQQPGGTQTKNMLRIPKNILPRKNMYYKNILMQCVLINNEVLEEEPTAPRLHIFYFS